MPNWAYNQLQFAGKKDFDNFVEKYTTLEDDERHVDFDKIIPMPKSLNIISGSLSDKAIECLTYPEKIKRVAEIYHLNDEPARPEWDKILEEGCFLNPESKAEFAIYVRTVKHNIENYGVDTWYDWAIDNWGTKWNASRTNIDSDSMVIYWETAWSPALDLMNKVFENDMPENLVRFSYAEEQVTEYGGEKLYGPKGAVAEKHYIHSTTDVDFFKTVVDFIDPDQTTWQWDGKQFVYTNSEWADEDDVEEYKPERVLESIITELEAQLLKAKNNASE